MAMDDISPQLLHNIFHLGIATLVSLIFFLLCMQPLDSYPFWVTFGLSLPPQLCSWWE
ncbi:hypothetical protein ACE6H2_010330 [Prunus campanulata]